MSEDFFDSFHEFTDGDEPAPPEDGPVNEPKPESKPKRQSFESRFAGKPPKQQQPPPAKIESEGMFSDEMLSQLMSGDSASFTDEEALDAVPEEDTSKSAEDGSEAVTISGLEDDPQTTETIKSGYLFASEGMAAIIASMNGFMTSLSTLGVDCSPKIMLTHRAANVMGVTMQDRENPIPNFALIPLRNEEDFTQCCAKMLELYRKMKNGDDPTAVTEE